MRKKKQTTDETTRGVVSIDKVSSAAARDKFTFPFQRSCWEVVLGSAAVLRHRVSDGGRSSGRPQISRTRSLGLRESAKKKKCLRFKVPLSSDASGTTWSTLHRDGRRASRWRAALIILVCKTRVCPHLAGNSSHQTVCLKKPELKLF